MTFMGLTISLGIILFNAFHPEIVFTKTVLVEIIVLSMVIVTVFKDRGRRR